MLSLDSLKQQGVQWQTSLHNVVQEYVQHVFLSHLYRFNEADSLAFKGGTALRILYGSPRFSEDLDFSGRTKPFHLAQLLSRTALRVSEEIPSFKTTEAKATSGGYLAFYECRLFEDLIRLELNISLRRQVKPDAVLVTSSLVPPYQCLQLPVKEMVTEKIEALLFRKKPRDFFDLYFLLRQRLGIDVIISFKKRLLAEIRNLESKAIQRELKLFLPVSYHKTITQLPKILSQELQRL